MIHAIFEWCVQLLVVTAGRLGITYEAINVWVFVIFWPIFTLLLVGLVVAQHLRIRQLSEKVEEMRRTEGSDQISAR